MKYYADVVESHDPTDIGARLGDLARRLRASETQGRQARASDLAREGLILAGMLEQAIADCRQDESPVGALAMERVLAAQRGTDWWADRLMSAWSKPAENRTAADDHRYRVEPEGRGSTTGIGFTVPPFATMGRLPTVAPEGYLFYSLFPEIYGDIGRSLGADWGDRPVVVVGVRSIGTSLSAAVAAGIRLAGSHVVRRTVRPIGDPFQRELASDPSLMDQWKDAASRGARFVAVDEGPGLSGSSLAAVAQAFLRAGASPERLIIVCDTLPTNLPRASDLVRRAWNAATVVAARPLMETMLQTRLAALLSTSTGLALTLIRDLSWGQWHAKEAPLLPQLERRKLLLWDREREVVAKFVGFGATGHLKARLARDLAGMKMAPTYRGFAHGFLLLNWEGASILDPRDPAARQVVLDAAPGYYAHLRRTYPAEIAVEFDDLAQTVEEISEAWLGDGHGDLVRRQAGMAAGADACALLGDQRPEPAEWAVRGASVVKVDAADHFLDHSWARNQDIAFDLAGFIEQWALTTVERARLLDSYVSRSADPGVHARLPFFHAVFAAHRLATLDTAYHAGVVGHAGAVDTERQRMGQALMAALTQRTAAACD